MKGAVGGHNLPGGGETTKHVLCHSAGQGTK